jgi:PAS domain S-box-containing protein
VENEDVGNSLFFAAWGACLEGLETCGEDHGMHAQGIPLMDRLPLSTVPVFLFLVLLAVLSVGTAGSDWHLAVSGGLLHGPSGSPFPLPWLLLMLCGLDTRGAREDVFSRCFSMNPIPAVIATLEQGVVVEVNRAYELLSGFSREDLVGKPLAELSAWSDASRKEALVAELRQNGFVKDREVALTHASGEVRDCLYFAGTMEHEGTVHVVSMVIDITERKRTEEALCSAESRYHAMVENTLNGVAIFRARDGGEDFEYLDFNRAAELIDAVGKDEIIGHTLLETFPGSRESGLFDALKRVWKTGKGEYLPVYFYRDERISGWRESFVYRLPSGELVEVYSDHTARVKAEEELLEHRRELYTLLGNLPGIVYRCRNDDEWTMLSLSEGCFKLTGYEAEDLIENRRASYGGIIHPDDRDRVRSEVREALDRKDHFQHVYHIVTATGEMKWVWEQGTGVYSTSGELLFIEGFVVDISPYKRVQEALKKSEKKFTEVFRASPDWVSITTLKDGVYIDVNEGYLRWSGYERDEVIGHTSLEIEIWEKPEERMRVIGKILEEGSVRNEEVKFRTKTGMLRTVLWSAVPMSLEAKECILGLGRDITEYKLMEEELQRAQKMEAVGRLAGSIAHDFNNYLAAIDGFCELAQMKAANAEAVLKNIAKIREVRNSASSLVRQLLSFSRKRPSRPEAVDLNEVIEGMQGLLVPVMGSKIKLRLLLDKRPCLVLGDRSQLEQVVMNLSLNARDAMPKGGTFTIHSAHMRITERDADWYRGLKPGEYVQVIVDDTGTGMDEETTSHVFDPYFTTKADCRGCGLGLTTVYNIVRQSGGSIKLRSEPDKGAIFTILLPAYDEGRA